MTEAWLLINESSLREAAGNPRGTLQLNFPKASRLEDLPDPKASLRQLLKDASDLKGRRLQRFDSPSAIQRLAELIQDPSLSSI
jgi:hypothetical protein